MYDNQIEDLNE